MTDKITAREFHESEGVDDWRILFSGASTVFRTGSFAKGVALVDAIGKLADAINHHPDVDLRYPTVRVTLISHDIQALSRRDADLARQISATARDLGIEADPAAAQAVQIAIDALVPAEVMPFWQAVLGYKQLGDEDLVDPRASNPPIWFQNMDASRPQRNRIHIDISIPRDQAEARIAAALAAGGRIVYEERAPQWWTLADPEGNECDVAIWPDSA